MHTFWIIKKRTSFNIPCVTFYFSICYKIQSNHPAGTQLWHDVESTLIQRQNIESTLNRHCLKVVCPLGSDLNCIYYYLTSEKEYWLLNPFLTFSIFYHGHSGLVSKYILHLSTILHEDLSVTEIYGNLVYWLRWVAGNTAFFKRLTLQHYCPATTLLPRGKLHEWSVT